MSEPVANSEQGPVETVASAASRFAAPVGGFTPGDLAELLGSFNEVTSRLEATHRTLRDEVARLKRELRSANEQLQRSRRLAALGEMAAGISHEIRNPLGSLRLYASMLAEDLEDRPEQQETAVKIGGAVQRLDAIVSDVLSFARDTRVRVQSLTAGGVFADAAEAVEPCLQDGVRVEAGRGSALSFEGDPQLLHQAVVNLLRNSADAIREEGVGGVIRLSAREAESVDEDEGKRSWVVLSIADDGPGVPPEVVERMFNPFFTTRAAGTGLGLPIVHRIADAHGGRVEITSEVGRGAAVSLWLPRVSESTGGGWTLAPIAIEQMGMSAAIVNGVGTESGA